MLDKAPFKEKANKTCFMDLLKIRFNLMILPFDQNDGVPQLTHVYSGTQLTVIDEASMLQKYK